MYFIDYAITIVLIFPFSPPPTGTPIPSSSTSLVHHWVLHIGSLASSFPVLFLTSPCLFCTYQLCFLITAPFPSFSLFPFRTDNPPNDLHICDSVPALVVCLVCFLDSVVDSCEFIAILMLVVLIFFFFFNKSL